MRSWGWCLQDGISAVLWRARDTWGQGEKVAMAKPWKGSSPEPHHAGATISNAQSPGLEEINVGCESLWYPVTAAWADWNIYSIPHLNACSLDPTKLGLLVCFLKGKPSKQVGGYKAKNKPSPLTSIPTSSPQPETKGSHTPRYASPQPRLHLSHSREGAGEKLLQGWCPSVPRLDWSLQRTVCFQLCFPCTLPRRAGPLVTDTAPTSSSTASVSEGRKQPSYQFTTPGRQGESMSSTTMDPAILACSGKNIQYVVLFSTGNVY